MPSKHSLLLSVNHRSVRLAFFLPFVVLSASSVFAGGIQWHTPPAVAVTTAGSSAATPDAAVRLTELAARNGQCHIVIQFQVPLLNSQRAALKAAGVELLSYLGSNAFFAAVDATRLDADRAAGVATIQQVEAIDPLVKLTPRLARNETPPWAVVNADTGEEPIIGMYVTFHRDVDLQGVGIPLIELYEGTVRDMLESINALVVEMPQNLVHNLAAEDAVQWIEEALPRLSECNNSNRVMSQADDVQTAPYNLDGTGVTVLVFDGGTVRATHHDFSGRLIIGDSDTVSDHSTHVAGTIGGDGSSSGGLYRGMAPNCSLLSYGFEYDNSGTFLYDNPGDIENDYRNAIARGADLANNSIGTNTETNFFDCEIQGNYGTTSILIDSIVNGAVSDGQPFRIIWANGNERQGSRCDIEGFGDYYSMAPPAGAKNHIAIGAVNSNDGSMTSFSSWGPMDDGRMKPDLCAPGCQSDDDEGVTSCSSSSDTAYTTKCGTSMAAPTATGLATLLLQDFRDQYPDYPDPRNATIKVLFAQTAQESNNVGPDYQTGYGIIRIKDAIDFMRVGNFEENEISQGESVQYYVNVPAGASELKATLAWDDHPGTANVNPTLVNDLDLEVYDPSNNRYYPWTLDPSNPSAPAVQTTRNSLDNIEQVLVNNPVAGQWRVVVQGHTVPEGPQTFSICASPSLVPSGIRFRLTDPVPTVLVPGTTGEFRVDISSQTETIVAGSELLHVRYDGIEWLEIPLVSEGGNLWRATLPPPTCEAIPEFYVSAIGSISGLVTLPSAGETAPFTLIVGEEFTVFHDDFETDTGWTVENSATLTDGAWDRGVPVGGGDRGDPPSDYDGSGQCYLTDNEDGNSDVDGGTTWLISPSIDLNGGNSEITYALWYTNNNGGDPNNDLFKIYVSNDNGANWVLVETVGPVTPSGGWNIHRFWVGDYVTPTAQVKVRYEASDLGTGSVVEAGVDAFNVGSFECVGTFDDCNENGILDADDIVSGRSTDANGNGIPDECESTGCLGDVNYDGVINISDLAQLLAHYGMTSGASFADGDLDEDEDVDIADLAALLGVYGQSCL